MTDEISFLAVLSLVKFYVTCSDLSNCLFPSVVEKWLLRWSKIFSKMARKDPLAVESSRGRRSRSSKCEASCSRKRGLATLSFQAATSISLSIWSSATTTRRSRTRKKASERSVRSNRSLREPCMSFQSTSLVKSTRKKRNLRGSYNCRAKSRLCLKGQAVYSKEL